MPPMPVYYVGKGTQFRVLDMFDGKDRTIYDETLRQLEDKTPLEALAARRAEMGSGLLKSDVQHFREDWLGVGVPKEEKWWPDKHVELVLRAGIHKAIKTALRMMIVTACCRSRRSGCVPTTASSRST